MLFHGNKLGNTLIRIIQVKLSELHVSSGFQKLHTTVTAENLGLSGGGIDPDLASKNVVGGESLGQSRFESIIIGKVIKWFLVEEANVDVDRREKEVEVGKRDDLVFRQREKRRSRDYNLFPRGGHVETTCFGSSHRSVMISKSVQELRAVERRRRVNDHYWFFCFFFNLLIVHERERSPKIPSPESNNVLIISTSTKRKRRNFHVWCDIDLVSHGLI